MWRENYRGALAYFCRSVWIGRFWLSQVIMSSIGMVVVLTQSGEFDRVGCADDIDESLQLVSSPVGTLVHPVKLSHGVPEGSLHLIRPHFENGS